MAEPIQCIMIGLGGPTFISDWAKAVGRFARVRGVTAVSRLPEGTEVLARRCGVKEVDGFQVAFVERKRLRPNRLFWKVNARLESAAILRAISLLGGPAPTVVHSHFFADSAGATRTAERLEIPSIVTEHSSKLATSDPLTNMTRAGVRLMSDVFERATLVIFVGNRQLESIEPLKIRGNFVVVPNPVDNSLFEPGKGDGSSTPKLVSVGHLIPRKRHELLLEALAQLRVHHPSATLDLVGDGPQLVSLEQASRRLGIEEAVRFHGAKPREDIARVFATASVYVHTATHESFGVAMVEAQLAGLPVVTTQCGGVSNELPNSSTIIVDEPSPHKLAGAIERAHTWKTDPRAISQEAARTYGIAAVARKIKDEYEALTS